MLHFKKYFFILLLTELLLSYSPALAINTSDNYDYSTSGVSTQITKYLCTPTPVQTNQTNVTNGALVSGLPGPNGSPSTFQSQAAFNNTNSGDLYKCINQLYKFAIVVAAVIGVFFLVIAGYVYMSAEGNSESVEKAKSIVTSTIASIVILLAGYILLKGLNPDLVQFHSIQPPSVVLNNASTPVDSNGGGPGIPTGGTAGGMTEQDARNLLALNGISVNAQPPQTTLVGIKQSTLSSVVDLKNACGNCQTTVTGGTEPGHSEKGTCTHSNGYKIDIGVTSQLDSFITKNYKFIGARSGDNANQYQNGSVVYARETSPAHWDISVCQ